MKFPLLSLAAAGLLCGITSSANDTVELQDITVSATKSAIETFEAPASVSVVNAETIESKSIQRADQALKDLSGVYVRALQDNRPSNFSNAVSLRGIPGYYRTAVLVDDIALNDGFSGAVNWSSIPVEEIERIEVVSGPFSSLYGGNAMGGVINIITKKPEKAEYGIKLGYGSDSRMQSTLYARDKITEKLGLSLNFDRQESDGFASDLVVKSLSAGAGTTPVTGGWKTLNSYGDPVYVLGDKGKRSWWEYNAGLKLNYDITPDSRLSAALSYHDYETDYEHFNSYLRDAASNPVYSGNVEIDDGGTLYNKTISEKDFLFGPNGQDITKYALGYDTKLGSDISVRFNAAYTEFGYWYVSQSTGATVTGGPGSVSEIPSKKTYGSLQVSFPLGASQFIVMGTDWNKNELEKQTSTLSSWRYTDSKTDVTYHSRGQSTTKAFFIQDEIALGEAWNLYLGGRYDYWETDGVVQGFGGSPYTLTYPTKDFSQFSPKASVVYLPSEKTTLRASVGQAFRAPTLSDLYSSWVSSSGKLSQANPNLKPEKTTSWELGIEQKFATNTSLRATYYENYLTDLIYTTDVSSTLSEKRNAGKAEIKGFELAVKQKLTDGINVFANFTYNDAKIVENVSVPESIGKKVTYVPEQQFNLGLDLQEGAWSGSVTGTYVDEISTKDDNSDIYKETYGAYESYFTVDIKAGYRINDALNVSLAIDNLLDTEYYQYYRTPGRTFFGEISYRF